MQHGWQLLKNYMQQVNSRVLMQELSKMQGLTMQEVKMYRMQTSKK